MGNWLQSDPEQPHWLQLLGLNPRKTAFVGILLLLLAITIALVWPPLGAYLDDRAMEQAMVYRALGDTRSAVLATTRILEQNSNNLKAARFMAEMAEQAGSPAALHWRRHIGNLERTDPNLLAWATQAIRFGDLRVAQIALSRVSTNGQASLWFHQTAAMLALQERKPQEAYKYFAVVARLAPSNRINQLNLATVQLVAGDAQATMAARKSLEGMRAEETLRLPALRALAGDSERRRDTNHAVQFAGELAREPKATLADKLQFLAALRLAGSADVATQLARMQRDVILAEDVHLVAGWMTAQGMARQAQAWMERLPDHLRSATSAQLALAESLAILRQWEKLRALTRTGNWRNQEHMRLVLLAYAMRGLGDHPGAQRQWNQAVLAAGSDSKNLLALGRMAGNWRWDAEAEQVWWVLGRRPGPEQAGALRSLYNLYSLRGDTKQLLRACHALLKLNSDDLVSKNNVAMLSGENLAEARRWAEEGYRAQPANPGYASTYAFALMGQQRAKEARAVLGKIDAEWFKAPSMAACYGLVLAAAGEPQRAREYLERAARSNQLLPEEMMLVNTARSSLK
jgi:predicted Zn-dependent protease